MGWCVYNAKVALMVCKARFILHIAAAISRGAVKFEPNFYDRREGICIAEQISSLRGELDFVQLWGGVG